ncbi:hypothetical protein LX64_00857 [Chitinophaga skermanii]|uniref:Uncharacterized protein n=1 Tax=Chitinophaga skermanii TaxID=331697 RepID=A0A327QV07_9BACT|nr:hypothetical protein LX64_00857 [Chitinophaga skermanii]
MPNYLIYKRWDIAKTYVENRFYHAIERFSLPSLHPLKMTFDPRKSSFEQ